MVNDVLTPKYASQPVVFLGYDTMDQSVAVYRKNRFSAAQPNAQALPSIMVDSGQQSSWGINFPDLAAKFSSMVDAELGRTPQAAIQASYTRSGNHFTFSAKVTNQSGVTLSWHDHLAMVHAIVYESFTDATRPDTFLTNNFVRVVASQAISNPLVNGATGSYTLTTPDLANVVNWNNLHMLVLVDYRPNYSSGPYDMLQAAFAQPASAYTITPSNLSFLIDEKELKDQTLPIQVNSASTTLTWKASGNTSWIKVSPTQAKASTPIQVTVVASLLKKGSQQGTVTIQVSDNGELIGTGQVPVSAYLEPLIDFYLPFLLK